MSERENPQPDDMTDAPEEDGSDAIDATQQLQRERDEYESRYLRAMADYQNLARRAAQNEVVAREQAIMQMARQLVTVLDHFDHALAVDPQKTSAADVLKGVVIVRDELLRSLQQFGVERLDVEPGAPFDPNKHEAMMRQPHDDLETDQVIQQLQPGYVLADKTLRPAKVSVAE